MAYSPNSPCPCLSGEKYKRCCRALHKGQVAESPMALMRSRFAGYALGLSEYVMDTTHPLGGAYEADRRAWEAAIGAFCQGSEFVGLEVLEASGGEREGWVTFRAGLKQGGRDVSFTERSRFVRDGERWLYHTGEVLGG